MTRFARAKGSKSSNERIPEEATSWTEMKRQLLEKGQETEDMKKKIEADNRKESNYKAFLNEVEEKRTKTSKWAEFPTEKSVKKVETSNNGGETQEVPKKKKKGLKRELEEPERILSDKNQQNEKVEVSNNGGETQEVPKKKKKGLKRKLEEPERISSDKNQQNEKVEASNNGGETQEVPKKKKKGLKRKLEEPERISSDKNQQNETSSDIVIKKKKVNTENQQKTKKKLEKTQSDIITDEKQNSEAVSESKNSQLKKKRPKASKVLPQKADVNQKQNSNGKKNKKQGTPKKKGPLTEDDLKKIEKKKEKKLRQLETRKLNKQNGSELPKKSPKPNKFKNTQKPERRKVFENSMNINGQEVDIAYMDGFPIKKIDADRIKQLRREMIGKGLPRSEINIALKLERRKAEKSFTREKKKVCFNCRKSGHNLSECPNLNNQMIDSANTGICFKCGSAEHTHFECKVVRGQEFKFAQCFICHESGHIARQCPDNAKGLYPNGGACKVCGDVTHLKKDCPKYLVQQEQLQQSLQVHTMNTADNPDCLDGNEESVKIKEVKRPNKIVKF